MILLLSISSTCKVINNKVKSQSFRYEPKRPLSPPSLSAPPYHSRGPHRPTGETRISVQCPLLSFESIRGSPRTRGVESVVDLFNYIKAKTSTLKRGVINYTERTGIHVNLFFNISAQSDNQTNLDIARLTSKIAVTTQRDSFSMITYVAFLESGRFYDGIISQHSHHYHVLPPGNFCFGES